MNRAFKSAPARIQESAGDQHPVHKRTQIGLLDFPWLTNVEAAQICRVADAGTFACSTAVVLDAFVRAELWTKRQTKPPARRGLTVLPTPQPCQGAEPTDQAGVLAVAER